jgi:hypothetical protein
VITGANSGLGRECARVLALRGASVGLACRNAIRATAVLDDFGREMGRDVAARYDILPCDLAELASVRGLASALLASGRPIDLLLLNAGVSNQPYRLTMDGIEAVGRTREPVGSRRRRHAHAPRRACGALLTAPSGPEHEGHAGTDGARVRPPRGRLAAVSFVGVCPGAVRTGNVNQMGSWTRRIILPLIGPFLRPVSEGTAPLLSAATGPELTSGVILDRRRIG